MLDMPVLRPIPLPAKEIPLWAINSKVLKKLWQLWFLLTSTRKWEVSENYFYRLPDGVLILIPRGFIFDGASTPKFMWGILDPVGLLLIPGLVHDFGYRYNYFWAVTPHGDTYKYGVGLGKSYFDKQFREVCHAVNGFIITGWLSWAALALLGFIAWNQNRKLAADTIYPTILRDELAKSFR